MPTRKELRREVKKLANIGTANLQMRQVWINRDVEHKNFLIAAMDTASVQVSLLTGYGAIDNALGRIDTTLPEITVEQAAAGIQILGRKQLVGKSFYGVYPSIVSPEDWADAVGADSDLRDLFYMMEDAWWEFIDVQKSGPKAPNPAFDRFNALTWGELERRVFGNKTTEGALTHMLVANRLLTLSNQTESYFMAKVNGAQFPHSKSIGLLWFMEEFQAVSPPG